MVVAVVPIFVSAGAAVLPTLATISASVLALVLRPRELTRLARQRPMAVGSGLMGLFLIALILWLSLGLKSGSSNRADGAVKPRYNWAAVAEAILAQESAGKLPTFPGQVVSPAAPPELSPPESLAALIGLKPLWAFQPEETMFLSAPAIEGQRVFVAGCQADLGDYTGLLACLDLATGKAIWKVDQIGNSILKPFFSSPALSEDGKFLLIGQGLHADRNCALLCFETATGKLRWSVKSTLHIESSPAVRGDLVVVGAGAIEGRDGRPTGDSGHVIAARISDGVELWRHPLIDPESSPAIDEQGVVYIGSGFNGNAVVALRSESPDELKSKGLERQIWKTDVGLPVVSEMTLVDDLLLTGAGNGDAVHSNANARGLVIAIERKTGTIRWQTAVGDSVLGSVAAGQGVVVAPVRTGEVVGLSLADGKIIWRTRISGDAPILAGCLVRGQYVYAQSSDGMFAVLNLTDGTLLEKLPLNSSANPGSRLSMSTPRIIGDKLIVGTETGGIRALVGSAGAR